MAIESGYSVAIMAPTEILAEQHYLTFQKWLAPLGVRLSLRTGNREEYSHEEQAQIIIGTHALFQPDVEFKDLAFVVIDEGYGVHPGEHATPFLLS